MRVIIMSSKALQALYVTAMAIFYNVSKAKKQKYLP